MFERFTDRARRVVVLAQEEARLLNHNYIGTEHILLGLVREGEGVAAQALTSMSIELDAVRGKVEEIIGQGQAAPTGHIPFTPRAKKVLELSLREALQLGHNYIGTEHILLGLLREGEGVAAQVLQTLGAELDRVRQAVIRLLGEKGQGPSAGPHEEVEGEGGLPGPRCPRCNADLAVFATYRTITVPDEEESGGRKAAFVFCRSCSYTLGMLPG
jgi:ATP-dependent Clp protease ATP-binding subunit ClpC